MKGSGSSLAQIVTATAAVVALLYFFRDILAPFFLAVLVIVVIRAISDRIVGWLPKTPHWIVMVLTSAVVSAVIVASFYVTLRGLAVVIPQTPQLISRLQILLQDIGLAVGWAEVPDLKSVVGNAELLAFVRATLANINGALSSVGLVILFVIFLLASRATIDSKIAAFAASSSGAARFKAAVKQIDCGVRTCVLMQTLYAALMAVGAGVVLFAFGLQDALFWAVVVFLLCYIPVFGSLVASIAPALFALVQFPTIWQAAAIFVAIQCINIVVGHFVMPKVQADSLNVDPTAGMVAFSIFFLLWGIPGAILSAPLTLALMIAFAQFETTRWIAVLISNDGKPVTLRDPAGLGEQ